MSGAVNNAQNGQEWNFARLFMFVKRRLKLNRFLLVIDTKRGVSISAITLIVIDLIDLLWHLSMTFGPLNSTMTSLLLLETFLVVCISSALLYAMKTENKSDLRSILFTWLVVVAIDYCLRAILNFSALFISEKASTTAKAMRSIESIILLVLIAHCWLCVFTYYDDNNGKINWFKYYAFDLWDEIGDPEAGKYFWLGAPWLTWLATVAYLYIVLKAGPDFMANRKPYDLKLAIRFYNLLLVVINAYLFLGTVHSFRYGLDFWGCGEALSYNKSATMLHYGHLFFHTRYLEFFDTFFFILRKKNSQVSFLHVFHHAIVPTLMYIGLKFYPIPFNSLLPMTNMFVHIIMYAYYGLATFGPKMEPYLWWKKYLTKLQISQFALLLIHCSQPIIFMHRPECKFPRPLIIINICIGLTFLSLFVSFYRQAYKATNKNRSIVDDSSQLVTMNGLRKFNGVPENNSVQQMDTSLTKRK